MGITTCGTSNIDFCYAQGADKVIDYKKADWHDIVAPRSVDFVYDTVALSGTGDLAYDVLKDGGAYVPLLEQAEASPEVTVLRPSVRQAHSFILNETRSADFGVLREQVDKGLLRPHVEKTFTF